MVSSSESRGDKVHRSPPLGVVATVFFALFVLSIVINAVMTHGAPYPTPYLTLERLQQHYLTYGHVIRLTSFLQLSASIPLAVLAASVASRLTFYRIDVAGVQIAFAGGISAAIFLGISASASWALSMPGVASNIGAMRVAQVLAFATGGFAHSAGLGLFLAGTSVPTLAFKILPQWLSSVGILLAGICMLSTFAMIWPGLLPLLPIGRFPAYLWLIAVGWMLPKVRPAEHELR